MCKKEVWKGFTVFLSLFCLLCLLFWAFLSRYLQNSADYGVLAKDGYHKLKSREGDSLSVLHLYDTYRDSLLDSDLEIYDAIFSCVQAYDETGSLNFVSVSSRLPDRRRLIRIARMVLYDHPKYGAFWSGGLLLRGDSELGISLRDAVFEVVPDSVYDSIAGSYVFGTTDEERLLSCYLYLQERVDYDDDMGPCSDCDVGVIRYGKACCQGISFALSRLLDAAGVGNVVVTCYTATEGYHMVNAVYLHSVKGYVFVDLTSGLSVKQASALDTMFLMDSDRFRDVVHRGVMFPIGGCLDWEEQGRSLRDVLGSCPAARSITNALRLVEN